MKQLLIKKKGVMKTKTQQPNQNKAKRKIPNTVIAERCGLTSQYIGQLRSGKRSNPESLQLINETIQQIVEEITQEYNIKTPKKKVA